MSFIKNIISHKNINQTVFGLSDLAYKDYTGNKLNSAIKYAVKQNELIRLSKGLYSLSKDYSKLEFANKFRSPSYISLYTVLSNNGVVFQPYTSIYVVSNRSFESEIDNQKYIYRKIKDSILLNPFGINNINYLTIASPERAICDKLYLDNEEYFDNLRNIDWELINRINTEVYSKNRVISKWIQKNTKQI
ncbi:MAG: hypothetical protein AAB778_02935 [Patescibacteria group bacterium]